MKLIEWINGKTKLNKTTFDEFQNNIKSAVVPTGGTTGQVLAKSTNTDNDVEWVNQTGGIVVVDNLTSTSTTDALSAKQGKILNDKITNATAYSTKEIDTGMKWIDNKDIYRRVFTATKVVSTDLNINVGNNIDTMLVISARLDGHGHYVLPFYESEQVYCRLELDGNNIKVKSGSSEYAQGTVTLIVEYTKTV